MASESSDVPASLDTETPKHTSAIMGSQVVLNLMTDILNICYWSKPDAAALDLRSIR